MSQHQRLIRANNDEMLKLWNPQHKVYGSIRIPVYLLCHDNVAVPLDMYI